MAGNYQRFRWMKTRVLLQQRSGTHRINGEVRGTAFKKWKQQSFAMSSTKDSTAHGSSLYRTSACLWNFPIPKTCVNPSQQIEKVTQEVRCEEEQRAVWVKEHICSVRSLRATPDRSIQLWTKNKHQCDVCHQNGKYHHRLVVLIRWCLLLK